MGKTEEIHIIDDKSRDYNIKDIETDPRFTQTTKEFWITLGVYVAFAALMIANLLILNGNKSLVLGFPLWIFGNTNNNRICSSSNHSFYICI